MAKDPAERPEDARAVAEVLDSLPDEDETKESRAQPLAELALQHETERAAEEAASSAAKEEAKRRDALHKQAEADLQGLLEDGTEVIQEEVPEATFEWQGSFPTIAGPAASLRLQVQPDVRFSKDDSALVVVEVTASNRRGQSDVLLANLVYEDRGDGAYRWILYRFRAQGALRDYPLGPMDRDHGLRLADFAKHRKYMSGGTTHIFVTHRQPLNQTHVRDLYAEALALPSPA